ncbi:MAG: class I SAM-dependent methyltransferase [Actinomycetales bacterium]|nr:class I SAM-dependent methyltransferase [Actinomycetales bacterium]
MGEIALNPRGAQVYDLLFPVVTREWAWRPRLISQLVAGLPVTTTAPSEAASSPVILDVGAGTGTQALAIAAAAPHARVVAVEPGTSVHAAHLKPNPHGVVWVRADAAALPFADGSADRIVISLALHHMSGEVRRSALREFRRVLAPDGRLHVVEFGRPTDPFMRVMSAVGRRLDDYDGMRDPYAGRIPALLHAAGFHVRPGRRRRTPGGVIEVTEAWPRE